MDIFNTLKRVHGWNKLRIFLIFHQAMVTVQMLSELEEIIQYKLMPERRDAIKQSWWRRLQVKSLLPLLSI